MKCNVCGNGMAKAFEAVVLRRYEVSYFRCAACGFLSTQLPFWLDEAYSSPINVSDTGLVQRNMRLAAQLAVLLYSRFDRQARHLDLAGGYGLLTRLMRDRGYDYWWNDVHCQNLLARGFESGKDGGTFEVLSAFEVLEHLHDPVAFVAEAFQRYDGRALVFSTELYEGVAAPEKDWWYYAFEGGQHVSFFQRRTLEHLARRLGLHFQSMSGLHVFTQRPLRGGVGLRMALGRLAPVAAWYVGRRMGSRTMDDHRAMAMRPGPNGGGN